MHFRMLKMIATSGFLAALKCTEVVFGRGSALDPAGELTALRRLPSWFKGTSKGKERSGDGKGRGRPPNSNSWIRAWQRQ